MNWLSFFIGLFLGWIIEWLIDLFYWRRKFEGVREENALLRARLDAAQAEIRTLEKKAKKLEVPPARVPEPATMPGLRVSEPIVEPVAIPPLEAAAAVADLAPEAGRPELSLKDAIAGLKARFPHVDIDGAIARLRAKMPDLDLKRAVAGLKIDFPDLDIDGALADLRARLPHLGGEKAEPATRAEEITLAAPVTPDDLVQIEGIGPKIAQLLNANGINTFAQLAAATPDRLAMLLQDAGPRFRLADPGSWPEQARLAADGAWDQLQALQQRLSAGREGPRPAQ